MPVAEKIADQTFRSLAGVGVEKMQQAEVNQLEAWSERIFDAVNLNAVFE